MDLNDTIGFDVLVDDNTHHKRGSGFHIGSDMRRCSIWNSNRFVPHRVGPPDIHNLVNNVVYFMGNKRFSEWLV